MQWKMFPDDVEVFENISTDWTYEDTPRHYLFMQNMTPSQCLERATSNPAFNISK